MRTTISFCFNQAIFKISNARPDLLLKFRQLLQSITLSSQTSKVFPLELDLFKLRNLSFESYHVLSNLYLYFVFSNFVILRTVTPRTFGRCYFKLCHSSNLVICRSFYFRTYILHKKYFLKIVIIPQAIVCMTKPRGPSTVVVVVVRNQSTK